MNRQLLNRRNLLIMFGVFLVICLFVFIASRPTKQPVQEQSYDYVDPDTGETLSVQPGVTPESFNKNGKEPLVIGLTSLSDFGSVSLSSEQLPLFRKDLASNAAKALGATDGTIKILKPRLNATTYVLEADLLYKAGAPVGLIRFTIPNNYNFSYQILVAGNVVYTSPKIDTIKVDEFPASHH